MQCLPTLPTYRSTVHPAVNHFAEPAGGQVRTPLTEKHITLFELTAGFSTRINRESTLHVRKKCNAYTYTLTLSRAASDVRACEAYVHDKYLMRSNWPSATKRREVQVD